MIQYNTPKFGQTICEATVLLECGHEYAVTVDRHTCKFKEKYPCQKCR